MNFNEVLIKDSQLTHRWGMEKFSRAMVLVVMFCVCSSLCKLGTKEAADKVIFILRGMHQYPLYHRFAFLSLLFGDSRSC